MKLTDPEIRRLSEAAWLVREKAHIYGKTKVGSALLTFDDQIFVGCNVEHKYRSHDVHAEVNAITSMVSAGHDKLRAILIAAERDRFTPCGGCMDWIMQFGGTRCLVGYESSQGGYLTFLTAGEVMPFYPQ